MITITKKVRAWNEGESVKTIEYDCTEVADMMADDLADDLRKIGHDPITITITVKAGATVLVKPSKEVA